MAWQCIIKDWRKVPMNCLPLLVTTKIYLLAMKPCNTFCRVSLCIACVSEKDINKRLKAVDKVSPESIDITALQYLLYVIETAVDYKVLYEQSVQLHAEYTKKLDLQITALQQELANLKRLIFGSKNERFVPAESSPSQLSLDMQTDAVPACSVTKTQKIEYIRNTNQITKEHPGRTKLPEHVERREIIIEPAEVTDGCKKI